MNKQTIFFSILKRAQKSLGGRDILRKYPFLKPINNFVVSQARSDFAEVDGHKMYLGPKDSLGLSTAGVREPLETQLVKKQIKEGDVVLDIGANLGYYTLIFARLVGSKGTVYSFEPEPYNFSLLKKNVDINGYKNVRLENAAISNKNGNTRLYLAKEHTGMHRIYPSRWVSKNYAEVKMIRLDDYFKDDFLKNRISFIKIDVEGSELSVLQGMQSLLDNNKEVKIMLEFVPSSIREFGAKPMDILELIEDNGFKFYFINSDIKKIERSDDLAVLLQRCDWKKTDELAPVRNLLCVRD